MKTPLRIFGSLLLCLALTAGLFLSAAAATPDMTEYEDGDQTPLFTVACFADLHVDYGIQNDSVPIRPGTVKAAKFVKNMGGADVVLVGGDMTSRNDPDAAWTKANFEKVQKTMYETLAVASHTGKVLFVTGNHDCQAGNAFGQVLDSGDWTAYMKQGCGDFADAYYEEDVKFPHLLCYRYAINGMEIIGINTPYAGQTPAGDSFLYPSQIDWVEDQLEAIGKDKTVILFCHYRLGTIGSKEKRGEVGDAQELLLSLLDDYPNVLYCYGHIHDKDTNYVTYQTRELVNSDGFTFTEPNVATGNRYITVHMGSMGYYNTKFQPGNLRYEEPKIGQVMMICFYSDHITFRMINTHAESGDPEVYDLASFAVLRDLSAQLGTSDAPAGTDAEIDAASTADTAQTDAAAFPVWATVLILVTCLAVLITAGAVLWKYVIRK